MAARKKEGRINLLPQEAFAASTMGRVLAWITSTFRTIVILTELIILIAFVSRFFLDTQNADLSEVIKQKQAVIAASVEFEKDFRDAQRRLETFSQLTSDEETVNETLNLIIGVLPSEVFLSSFVLGEEENISLEGFSTTERAIQQFIVNLQATDLFGSVSILQVESGTIDPTLSFFRISISPKVQE